MFAIEIGLFNQTMKYSLCPESWISIMLHLYKIELLACQKCGKIKISIIGETNLILCHDISLELFDRIILRN